LKLVQGRMIELDFYQIFKRAAQQVHDLSLPEG
jgi:hypothetical protein